MAAAPSGTWVDCPAVWGWTMILHWLGTQPRLIDSKLNLNLVNLNLINRNSIKSDPKAREKCEQEGANWVKENGLLTLCGDCLRSDCYHLEQVRGRV